MTTNGTPPTHIAGYPGLPITSFIGKYPGVVPNAFTSSAGTYLDNTGAWSVPVGSGGGVTSVTGSGSGITVSPTTGAVVVSNTGVTSNVAGTGISVSGATGAVTITNTGVTSIIAGTGISRSAATGAVTVTNTGVTSIVAGTNITISGSTGAVTINASSSGGFPGYVRPEDHGAVANGTTDDTVAIMAAYAACTGGQALYLTGSYGIGTAAALSFNTVGVGVVSSPTTLFNPSSSAPATNGVSLGAGSTLNYQSRLSLPNFSNFSGYAVQLEGANLLKVNIGQISMCGVALSLNANGAAVLDNTVEILNLNKCTIAVQCIGDGTHVAQGNRVDINFVNGCTNWVQFGTGGQQHSDNTFSCDAVEVGGTTNPKIIFNNSGSSVSGNRFICRGFFGNGATVTGTIVSITSTTPGTSINFQQCEFYFGNIAASFPSYTSLANPEFNNDFTSRYDVNFGGTPENVDGPTSPWFTADTTSGNRATWPGTTNFPAGVPVAFNRLPIAFKPGTNITAGASATFFVYSPFAQGHARLSFSPASMVGAIVTGLVDNYGTNPNEVAITITNASSSTITTSAVLTGFLVIGIP